MEQNLFEKSVDQTRTARLRDEILAFVEPFENKGYDNLDIARALLRASFRRVLGDDHYLSFMQFARDHAAQCIASELALGRSLRAEERREKSKAN